MAHERALFFMLKSRFLVDFGGVRFTTATLQNIEDGIKNEN